MSTKIYNAFEWSGSLTELMDRLFEIRTEYVSNAKKKISKYFAEEAGYDYEKTEDALEEQMGKIFPTLFDELAFSASFVIYVHSDRLFFQSFCMNDFDDNEQPVYLNFIKSNLVKDFHYQNQVDPPSEVSAEEWESRQQIWDTIFKRGGSPSRAGLHFKMLDWFRSRWILGEVYGEHIRNKKQPIETERKK